jgi:hypothetical protein
MARFVVPVTGDVSVVRSLTTFTCPLLETHARFVTDGTDAAPGSAVIVNDELSAAAIVVVCVAVTTDPAVLKDQPLPAADTYVIPAGSVSTTTTSDVAESAPTFLTVMVYVPLLPCISADADELIPRSGALTGVVTVALLLVVSASPPPDTHALLVAAGYAAVSTSTVRTSVCAELPAPIAVLFVAVTTRVAALYATDHLLPDRERYATPTGSVSVIVAVPDDPTEPAFETMIV